MGIMVYRKAGCRAIKNTNKKKSISAKKVKADTHLGKKLVHLTLSTIFEKKVSFFFASFIFILSLLICTLV